jgi:hypothetical protein
MSDTSVAGAAGKFCVALVALLFVCAGPMLCCTMLLVICYAGIWIDGVCVPDVVFAHDRCDLSPLCPLA